MKQNRLNSLENQHDKLYDTWEKVNQSDVQNSIQLSQKYQHMTDGAIKRVYRVMHALSDKNRKLLLFFFIDPYRMTLFGKELLILHSKCLMFIIHVSNMLKLCTIMLFMFHVLCECFSLLIYHHVHVITYLKPVNIIISTFQGMVIIIRCLVAIYFSAVIR